MNTIILSVGTELLLGDGLDTNSKYIAEQCKKLGFNLDKMVTVGDHYQGLKREMERAFEEYELIITTGGLGPTEDDRTKEVAMDVLHQQPVLHKESMEHLKKIFHNDENALEKNKKQALFPENALVFPNDKGTAPGGILRKDNRQILILPGPPRENQWMFEHYALPHLKKLSTQAFYEVKLKIEGFGEWEMADKVRERIKNDKNPTIAPYSGEEGRFLKIIGKGHTKKEAKNMVDPVVKEMKQIFGDKIYGENEDQLEDALYRLLKERKETVITAESITGGMICSRLINVPGMSNHLTESLVLYSDEAKIKYLDIPEIILKKHSAVSYVTIVGMLDGLANRYKKDLSICSTGYAGPGANAGLVFVGAKYKGAHLVRELHLTGDRNENRKRACTMALDIARQLMLKNP
ncbi:MAG: CinA family nicotinamide mononucleotide deamidase-related protein [Tissierellia bacterium]|nr:CinA family nicotinamide mononucleotide deamidase-related protein [Tissierellia bacterium]